MYHLSETCTSCFILHSKIGKPPFEADIPRAINPLPHVWDNPPRKMHGLPKPVIGSKARAFKLYGSDTICQTIYLKWFGRTSS